MITMLTFKIHCRIGSAKTVKTSWVSGNIDLSNIFIPICSADGLGFTIALQAKVELRIHFKKKLSHPT